MRFCRGLSDGVCEGGGGCDKRLVTTALSKPLCYESVGGQQLGNRDCRGVTYRLGLISLPLK